MYALWAPDTSNITYTGSIIDGTYKAETLDMTGTNNPTSYDFKLTDYKLTINAPNKPGYELQGWYIYQSEEKNANWGYDFDPKYKVGTSDKTYANLDFDNFTSTQHLEVKEDGSYELSVEATNFGDVILVVDWETATADLTITKDVDGNIKPGRSFIFNVVGKPTNPDLPDINMTVTVQEESNIVSKDLPFGTYTVSEDTDWSWRNNCIFNR